MNTKLGFRHNPFDFGVHVLSQYGIFKKQVRFLGQERFDIKKQLDDTEQSN